ncbi:MAG: histidinol dehydrogenase, partial [Staphylococcus simulans]
MLNKTEFYARFQNVSDIEQSLIDQVNTIIQNVKKNQDKALFDYNKQFDGVELSQLEVPQADIEASLTQISPELREALTQSFENIKAFQERIKHEDVIGEYTSEIYNPRESVGIYVPGGKAAYPSTV